MSLFENTDLPKVTKPSVVTFINRNDKKGLVDYLKKSPEKELVSECLKAGFSLISFSHGKMAVINHIVDQIDALGGQNA